MSASSKTPNYDLPIFQGNDIPSWLTDWNNAMTEIDSDLAVISSETKDVVSDVTKINTAIGNIQNTLTGVTSSITDLNIEVRKQDLYESQYNKLIPSVSLLLCTNELYNLNCFINFNKTPISGHAAGSQITLVIADNFIPKFFPPLDTVAISFAVSLTWSGGTDMAIGTLTFNKALKQIVLTTNPNTYPTLTHSYTAINSRYWTGVTWHNENIIPNPNNKR